MKVAVTGGSGIVGAAIVRLLIDEGHDVLALARSTKSGSALAALGANPIPGDLLDPESLAELVAGTARVFHVAGVNELCTRDPKRMWNVNVEGTRLVVDASRRAGVERVVVTSSAVTMGGRPGEVANEETRHRGSYRSEYERTKSEGESLAISLARGIEVVVVNPSSVQGPGRATGTGRLLLQAARGRLKIAMDTAFSIVDINDCARGHLLAAEKGVTGERYILSGATLSMPEAVAMINEIAHVSLQPRYLSGWQASTLGYVGEAVSRLGGKPPICREVVRVMTQGNRYDGSKATEQLGLRYVSARRTLADTVAWFQAEGLMDSAGR